LHCPLHTTSNSGNTGTNANTESATDICPITSTDSATGTHPYSITKPTITT
jgi:hypothetical protein